MMQRKKDRKNEDKDLERNINILSRFPDKDLAAQAIKWMKEQDLV